MCLELKKCFILKIIFPIHFSRFGCLQLYFPNKFDTLINTSTIPRDKRKLNSFLKTIKSLLNHQRK